MNTEVIIVGGFIEIIELCEDNGISIYGIIDDPKIKNKYRLLGNDDEASKFNDELKKIPLIITPDLPSVRKKLKLFYQDKGYYFEKIISSEAKIAKSTTIGIGTIIQYGVNISSEVEIGDFVKINSMANIMHNVKVGNYTTIAPSSVILGHANIGEQCYIGANSTIMPLVKITDNVTIGAGAVVTQDINEANCVYAGVPAKKIK